MPRAKTARRSPTTAKRTATNKQPAKKNKIMAGTGSMVINAASSFLGGKYKTKGVSSGKKNAKIMLKRAYERKAKRLIHMGLLGQARRTLRKKATVV